MPSLSSPARALARRAFLPIFVCALLGTPAVQAANAVSNDDLVRYADQLFAKAYPADEPGAAVLIAKGGKPLLRKGYGMANLELGVPIQPDMVFEVGSITQQFTPSAI